MRTSSVAGRGWRRGLRWTAGGLTGAAVLLAALSLGVRHGVDRGTAERYLARLLSAPERHAQVDVRRAEARLWGRRARLEDVSLRVTRAAGGEPTVLLEADGVEVRGVSVLSLVSGEELRAERLSLERPSLVLRPGGDDAGGGGRRDRPGPGRTAADGGAPGVSLGRLEVRDGRIAVGRGPAGATAGDARHVVEGLTLRLTDVGVEDAAEEDGVRVRVDGAGNAAVERYRGLLPGGMHGIELHRIAASLDGDSARIDSLRLRPLPDEDAFLRRLEHRKDRVQVLAGPIRARGLDVGRLARREGLLARRVDVAALGIAVHTDKRLPVPPDAGPPVTPPERLRDADAPVAVDTLRVRGGRVEYAERTSAADRPGRLSFEQLDATFLRLTNVPARAERDGPAVVRVNARLFGAGLLRTEFEIPVQSPDLDFAFAGELGAMDLRSLNDMLEPVEGIRVQNGRLERLSFEARVRSGHARGTVRGRYRDLAVVKVDPESGDQSLPDMVESIFLDAGIERSNPARGDEEPRVGEIEHRRAPDDPFFRFLWESLRSGLLALTEA